MVRLLYGSKIRVLTDFNWEYLSTLASHTLQLTMWHVMRKNTYGYRNYVVLYSPKVILAYQKLK